MLKEYIEYLEGEVKNHSIYVWGGQGQKAPTITEAWIKSRETSSSNAKRAIAYWKKQVAAGYGEKLKAFDCSGLGMYWLQNVAGISKTDMTAQGMKGKCRMIERGELRKGDWVFRVYTSGSSKGRAYHLGYVVDDELRVIEAKGRDDGVVKRTLNASGAGYWNAYGRPSYFEEEIEAEAAEPIELVVSRLLKYTSPYMKGEDVKQLQRALNNAGCECGSVDGIFGKNTRDAVKAYQKLKGLKVDGIAGEDTVTALGGEWKAEKFTVTRLLKKKSPLMTGEDVKAVQNALIARGYSCGSTGADGEYGKNTEAAVKKFQKAAKLTVDGIAGKNTVTALGGEWKG